MISVVLVDDHPVVRKGFKALLDAEADIEVIGEASNGTDAIELAERLNPDVFVLDVMIEGLNGLEAAKQIKRRCYDTAIVMLSMYDNEEYVVEALRSGANAYVLKGSTSEEFLAAVRGAAEGKKYLSPPLSEKAIEFYTERIRDELSDSSGLTFREREILQYIAQGETSSEIAARIHISPRTVDTHRTNIMKKTGVKSKAELVRYALEHGIVIRME